MIARFDREWDLYGRIDYVFCFHFSFRKIHIDIETHVCGVCVLYTRVLQKSSFFVLWSSFNNNSNNNSNNGQHPLTTCYKLKFNWVVLLFPPTYGNGQHYYIITWAGKLRFSLVKWLYRQITSTYQNGHLALAIRYWVFIPQQCA